MNYTETIGALAMSMSCLSDMHYFIMTNANEINLVNKAGVPTNKIQVGVSSYSHSFNT